jgi:diguanylate cyclase (GGDEF)-like protein/PAS domain S-box-containing protein
LPSLDPIVDLAARLFDCPAAAVNMIGDDHVFLASSVGIGECDLRRDVSFCAHAINQAEVMVIEDAALDPRFHDNPLVTEGLIRFYAGIALRAPSGHALGALCVLDDKPHAGFGIEDQARLSELAQLAADKLELRRLEAVAATQPSRFEASAAISPNAIICFDADARISACNDAASAMFGHAVAEMVGQSIDLLIADQDRATAYAGIARMLAGDTPITVGTAIAGIRRNGEQFPAELHWSRWDEDARMHFGAIVQDMTDKRREHEALYRLANYDTLTDLPNRNLLQRRIGEMLKRREPLTVIVADLDGFADINNTLGHAVGDRVLIEASRRIATVIPEPLFLARLGRDEFAVIIESRDPLVAQAFARVISAAVGDPIVVDGRELLIATSCGIAIAPAHGESEEELLGSAKLALFHARGLGRGQSFLFIPNLRAEAVARRIFDAELHRAFERHEFELFYQPQVRLSDGSLTGAEALIRWKHPQRGLLSPAAFLPALEAGVLAEPIAQWVLDIACAQAAVWRAAHPDFRMSVNLSAAQFRRGELPELVAGALARHGLAPEGLELEITENIILDRQEPIRDQLERIRRAGTVLSFDDFGTGFASLNLLRDFPVAQIKIDKSFTQLMRASASDRIIVLGMIAMARRLKLEVVAEGIENQADADFLCAHGCQKGQGYLFGQAMPAAVFEERFWEPMGDLRCA